MNLSIERENQRINTNRVVVSGEIDVYTAPEFKKNLLPLTELNGGTLIVDLTKTNYMDSTAIGVIVAALKSSVKHHCKFSVVGLTPRIERLFEITGLTELIARTQVSGGETND
ncbi:STAS domain-containing protein [Sporolactobacillus inulinus]|uniref:Anti-sigma factor antagonist n=1 Tax=Sporolactobacillus inulinus CASD TaxID=1069536 RepID=A0A0U1QQU8_9BACL|nr:STAS domain-containing protein [Sporolactobacillus inulinus]KLI03183.1 hypothetical protein SINU_04280 [Sporolactobacillus inulinus CASD]GEB76670.1 anti-sigma-B factor antagonist [Sporolactobacillus inulinus]